MNSTSESLLLRLRSANDFQAWSRFVDLYTPLLFFWARKIGLQQPDAADLVQEVLTLVHQKMPGFTYDEGKSFRGWLRTVTLNKHRELQRRKSLKYADASQSLLEAIPEDVAASVWDLDYQQTLVGRSMEILRKEFQPNTWNALREYVLSDRPAVDVAKETGLSVWTIYAAKSRLLSRMRELLDGLLD